MRLSVLTDNHAGSYTMAEHGLSFLIEHEGRRILFDTGQSNLFMINAKIMNVTIEDIDLIVLSHGHFDHGNGLSYLRGGTLICHPACFIKRYSTRDDRYIGLKNSEEEVQKMFDLKLSKESLKISEKIIFLGEIPRLTEFESQATTFICENGDPDFVMDDSAVAFILDEGLFVVTGCGDAGIVNILRQAIKVTGINKLFGVIGGFHLKENDRQTKETIRYLNLSGIRHVLPSHCTELPALSSFYENFGMRQVKTGDILSF